MDNNKYVEIIKEKIETCVKKDFPSESLLTPKYFENLFPKIKEVIKTIAKLLVYPEVDEITLKNYYEIAKKEYLSINPVDIAPSNSLTKDGFKSWLTSEIKSKIKWNYTDRYLRLLENINRSKSVINETDQSSMEIMEKLGDPKSVVPFYIKGLVVGEVQSGKTENFNAVINRSIDCGYGLIIVLSGIMEDLRSQTQKRIENDVIGTGVIDETNDTKGVKGVGKIIRFGNLGDKDVTAVASITSYKTDFKKTLADADFSLDFTNILVCKKNISILKNLIVWLHDFLEKKGKHNIPLLIIDDEADNASLNNLGSKGREYASKINSCIRALLSLFKRKTYLGYTATPFANVLQDRNDTPEKPMTLRFKIKGKNEEKKLSQVDNIFPDDFIVLLNTPSNYVGAKLIFDTIKPISNKAQEKIPLICLVNDNTENFPSRVYTNNNGKTIGVENFASKDEWNARVGEFNSYLDFSNYKEYRSETRASRRTDNFPQNIPESLKEAIMCFILSTAIRDSRKPSIINSVLYNPHNTMLIHISRFTLWQNTTKNLIEDYVKEITSSIYNDNLTSEKSIYLVFKKIWYQYYATIIESISDFLPTGYVDDFITPIVFDSLKEYIPEAVKGMEVKSINSVTHDKLEYTRNQPKNIIAIGGNRLSRGFTLEGLTINYFVRPTNYSDTLLQMGRWFGYRPGYLDCCKIFTTQDSIDKFHLTTKCIEELETEFRKMESKGKTPQNFVLRVKKHPGALKITRPSILKNTTDVKWSYQDQLEMTTDFDVRKENMEIIWKTFKEEVAPLFISDKEKPKGFLVFPTDGKGIIELLKKANNFRKEDRYSMIKFIELCLENKKLTNWTVALKTTGNADKKKGKGRLTRYESNLPVEINLSVRRGPTKKQTRLRDRFLGSGRRFKATGKSANITSSPKDLSLLLSETEIKNAENEYKKNKIQYLMRKKNLTEEEAEKKVKTIPERVYREKMKEDEGLLIIYLFDSYYSFNQEKKNEDDEFKQLIEKENYNLDIPIVGYAIGFPPIEEDPGGIYVQGDYNLDIDEETNNMEFQDENEDDFELPTDLNE